MEPSPLRIEIYIQARMGSTRLPGKVLLPLGSFSALWLLISRLQRMKNKCPIVVLTSNSPLDDPIRNLVSYLQIPCFSGSQNDVLDRFYQAAKKRKPDAIVRITADCPLLDPHIVDKVIDAYSEVPCDYLSNTLHEPYPHGMDVEVFSRAALEKAHEVCLEPDMREHVTLGMYRNPKEFSIRSIETFQDSEKNFRLTLDTKEDYTLLKQIAESLFPKNPEFSLADIVQFLEKNPDLLAINSHIQQKKL